jgi:hypothetical protein
MSSVITYGQGSLDYVILKTQENQIADTIFGKIELPASGILLNVRIQTANGIEKYKIKEAIAFKSGELYFGSFAYNQGYVFAPRIIEGPMELYFYYSGSGGHNHIYTRYVIVSNDFKTGLIATVLANALQAVAVSATSYFYIVDPKTYKYMRVPHSLNNFIEDISEFFKNDEFLYTKIKNGDYKPNQIAEIVQTYNKNISEIKN